MGKIVTPAGTTVSIEDHAGRRYVTLSFPGDDVEVLRPGWVEDGYFFPVAIISFMKLGPNVLRAIADLIKQEEA